MGIGNWDLGLRIGDWNSELDLQIQTRNWDCELVIELGMGLRLKLGIDNW